MKIAIVCSGLGKTRRGFESFYQDLFEILRNRVDITVFKGGGTRSEKEIVLKFPGRNFYQQILRCSWRRAYRYEQIGCALGILPFLLSGRFDIIHFSDWLVGKWLCYYQNVAGLRAKLLFTDGAWIGPEYAKNIDFVHYLTDEQYRIGVESGLHKEKIFLIPHGITCSQFETANLCKHILRERYQIPRHKKVILCVATIEKTSKRIDWLIEEVAALNQEHYFLLVCGAKTRESDELELMGRSLLGKNIKFMSVPRSEIRDIYALSDLFVLPSIQEGFGIVLLEAMAARLPILAHQSFHFQWLLQNNDCLVDMEKRGALSSRIREIILNQNRMSSMVEQNYHHVRTRYDWGILRDSYVAMYQNIYQRSLVR